MELKASALRIVCKCDAPPPADHVFFALSADPLQVREIVDGGIDKMKLRDEVVLRHNVAGDVATKVTIKKSVGAIVAEFTSQYVLPSGDVEPLTISRGNRKLKELERVHDQASNAEQSIGDLRLYRRRLDGQLRRAQNIDTVINTGAGAFENPVMASQKAAAIARVQREIVATEGNIAQAEQLIADKPAIERDLQAINAVAEFAESLRDTPVPFRFFTVVAGREIDLVVGE